MTATIPLADSATQDRDLGERRKLGAYYTPERLSQILSDWAIRSASDTVLEPSFGGCGFLAAARDTLARHGSTQPVRQIFGCDIDEVAFRYLASVFGGPTDTGRIHASDKFSAEGTMITMGQSRPEPVSALVEVRRVPPATI